jgi:DNA-binding MarR family transcriptional regulator
MEGEGGAPPGAPPGNGMPSKNETIDSATCRRISDACACFNLRKAARAVTQLYDQALRPTGLRSTQFTLLIAIRAHGPVPMTRLADEVIVDRTTMTRNLAILEKEGLVSIRHGDDQRVREVSLTARGRHALAGAHPYWKKAQQMLSRRFGKGKLDRLLSDLTETVDAARAS